MKKEKTYETLLLIFMVIAVLGGIIIFVSRASQPKEKKENLSASVNIQSNTEKEEKSNLKTITTQELKEKIVKNENLFLLDVQDEENYFQKHLPGAINIPSNQLEAQKDKLPRDKEIIVMGPGEKIDSCLICENAAKMLISLGFSNVTHFREGVAGWEEAGLPVVMGTTSTYKNIGAEQLKQKIDDKENILIVDLRPLEEYNQEKIPQAISMPFAGILTRISELPRDKEIIFYDKTGQGSRVVVEELVKKGVINATNLIGGFLGWKGGKYPTEKGENSNQK